VERFLAAPLAAMLIASAEQCWSEDRLPYKPIAEEALRAASARLYSDILRQQCMQGRRYSQSQIESGFKRHFEESRRKIVDEGYTIVPNVTENNSLWTLSEMGFDAKRRLDLPRQFGCFGAYWLDDNPDW
jgi:hypothetical protein